MVADTDRLIDLRKKNLAVTNLAGRGRLDDGFDGGVYKFIGDYQFNLDFWQEIHTVFAASIGLRVTFLASMAAHFKYGHALDPELHENFFDRLKLGGLNDRFEFSHDRLSSDCASFQRQHPKLRFEFLQAQILYCGNKTFVL